MALEEEIGKLFAGLGQTLAIAESCTGGLVSHRITNVSGSSDYFERSVVCYSDRAKVELLGVPEALLARVGAVSAEVAQAMATGVRSLARTDFGLSITGIAGPSGATETKQVGLVFTSLSTGKGEPRVERHQFSGDRLQVKEAAAEAALKMLWQEVQRRGK